MDTDLSELVPIDLCLGQPLPSFAIRTDKRYCKCGNVISQLDEHVTNQSNSVQDEENYEASVEEEEISLSLMGSGVVSDRTKSNRYMCNECLSQDQLNLCTVYGVLRNDQKLVDCSRCYKWNSECSAGFCVYLACLRFPTPEIKVGITKLRRIKERAAEAGYSLMGIILPANRNSLTQPEAEFLEKRIISGISLEGSTGSVKISQRFSQDIGMVGKAETKQATLHSIACVISESMINWFKGRISRILSIANRKCLEYSPDSSAKELVPLRLADLISDPMAVVDEHIISSIDTSRLSTWKSQTVRGRSYKRIPQHNRIVAVKGPCIILGLKGAGSNLDYDSFVAIRFSKFSVTGREIFVPSAFSDSNEEAKLEWFQQ